jgi:hypothetical protein
MCGFAISAGVCEVITHAEIVTDLWGILRNGSDTGDGSDEYVIEHPTWNMEPLQQEGECCSEKVTPLLYVRFLVSGKFCVYVLH